MKKQRKPEPLKLGLFFHLKRVWLSMAIAGLLGEQNNLKAQYHVRQWLEHRRHELIMGNSLEFQGDNRSE